MDARTITLEVATQTSHGRFVAEASELGIAPGGGYPAEIATNLGNGHPFAFLSFTADGGAEYRQSAGCITLLVLND